jgi:hypothetical protein
MRSTYRSVLVALMAVLALSAVAAASASAALPEFESPHSGFPLKFTTKSVYTSEDVEAQNEDTVNCNVASGSGTITGKKALTVSSGQMALVEPEATLGYLNKPEVGLRLNAKGGGNFPALKCPAERFGTIKVTGRGPLFCSFTPINTLTTKFTLTCQQSAKGRERWSTFEGLEETALFETEGTSEIWGPVWGWWPSSIAAKIELTTAEAVKILA